LTKYELNRYVGVNLEVEEKAVGGAYADLWSPNPGRRGAKRKVGP